jgi:hypothetical protein
LLGYEPLALALTVPHHSSQTCRPDLDRLGLSNAECLKRVFPIPRKGSRNIEECSVNSLAGEFHGLLASARIEWSIRSDYEISLSRPNPEAPQLVGESVRGNSKEPDIARTKEALRTQKIFEFRIRLFELQQHLVVGRPPGERDGLRAVQTSSPRQRSTCGARHYAPSTSKYLAHSGEPEEQNR